MAVLNLVQIKTGETVYYTTCIGGETVYYTTCIGGETVYYTTCICGETAFVLHYLHMW